MFKKLFCHFSRELLGPLENLYLRDESNTMQKRRILTSKFKVKVNFCVSFFTCISIKSNSSLLFFLSCTLCILYCLAEKFHFLHAVSPRGNEPLRLWRKASLFYTSSSSGFCYSREKCWSKASDWLFTVNYHESFEQFPRGARRTRRWMKVVNRGARVCKENLESIQRSL